MLRVFRGEPSAMPSPITLAAQPIVLPDRRRGWLERLWSSIAERAGRHGHAAAAPLARAKLLAEALLSERGEASGTVLAQELQSVLREASLADRLAFHHFVATRFDPDPHRLRAAAETYLHQSTPQNAAALAEAAEPLRQELLRRMNIAQGGTASLVAMRQEILAHLAAHPALSPLDADLRHLLASWFNRGFLQLRRIDWQTPAAVLEKLITYEAVHEIAGWPDLRRRLAPDRRCFGFFHPALPDEPLIFVEVALVRGLATAIAPLLNTEPHTSAGDDRSDTANTAIFYSISNCQEGLRGISFGNFLIKQVVVELKRESPHLRKFATLSPVPGFRRWLERCLHSPADMAKIFGIVEANASPATGRCERLLQALAADDWWRDPAAAAGLRPLLSRACAVYLTTPPSGGSPIDAVARFHLGNGAQLEQINWLGNTSPRGLRESCGIMVNYLYDPECIEANHEAFVHDGHVMRSAAVDALLAPQTRKARGARIASRQA